MDDRGQRRRRRHRRRVGGYPAILVCRRHVMASSVVAKTSPGFFIHRREMTWITPPQERRRARSAGHAPTQMERARSSLGQPPHEAWQVGGCELFGRGLKLLYRPQERAAKHPRLPGSEDTGSRLEGGHAREMT